MNRLLNKIVLGGVFAAIITLFMTTIRIPTITGYIHIGDGIIYIASMALPFPFGILSAAIGGGVADLIGYPIFILPTVIIKSLNSAVFYLLIRNRHKLLTPISVLVSVLSSIITVLGYFIAENYLFGYVKALESVPPNIVQAGASIIIFILFSFALDKIKFNNIIKTYISK